MNTIYLKLHKSVNDRENTIVWLQFGKEKGI